MDPAESYVNIQQAAEILKITTKTVRNYIERGFLPAEKWNGSWRISCGKLKEIYEKKYGKYLEKSELDKARHEALLQISRQEYADLQQRVGKLQAVENQCLQQETDLKGLNERLAQLEASSASGWTEARKFKADIESIQAQLLAAKKQEQDALLESDWLRREVQRLRTIESEQAEENRKLEKSNTGLEERVRQLQGEVEQLNKQLSRLQDKYRRDSFLE